VPAALSPVLEGSSAVWIDCPRSSGGTRRSCSSPVGLWSGSQAGRACRLTLRDRPDQILGELSGSVGLVGFGLSGGRAQAVLTGPRDPSSAPRGRLSLARFFAIDEYLFVFGRRAADLFLHLEKNFFEGLVVQMLPNRQRLGWLGAGKVPTFAGESPGRGGGDCLRPWTKAARSLRSRGTPHRQVNRQMATRLQSGSRPLRARAWAREWRAVVFGLGPERCNRAVERCECLQASPEKETPAGPSAALGDDRSFFR